MQQSPPGKGMATASLVLGIVSLVFAWFGYFAILSIAMSIVGIVLGVNAKKKNAEMGFPPGLATGGLVCSIIALILSSLVFILCTVCVAGLASVGLFA